MDDHVKSRVLGWATMFGPVARSAGVRVSLAAGVIAQESGGDPGAQSPMNYHEGRPIGRAQGLMQVLPGHFGLAVDPSSGELPMADGHWARQPGVNVARGVGVLAAALERYGGSEESAVAAYFGAVDAAGRPTMAADATGTPGTQYVALVTALAEEFRLLDELPWERWRLPAELPGDVPRSLCQYGETWQEVAANLLGVCDDALAAGRAMARHAREIAEQWGSR